MYKRLTNICKKNGISITKLCIEVTGSKGNLATWKKGHMMSDQLSKCADYFNCSTDYLLGRTDTPEINRGIIEKPKKETVSIETDLFNEIGEIIKKPINTKSHS